MANRHRTAPHQCRCQRSPDRFDVPVNPPTPCDSAFDRTWEVAKLFLRLGATAFGGPAAHIALIEEEVVRRRQWLTRDEFLDLLGATNLIPGPNSTELAIHIGHRRAGTPGLIAAGVAFILPAFIMVTALGWGYVRFGRLPKVEALFLGVKPVIVAIIAQALVSLARSAVKDRRLAVVGVVSTAFGILGLHELAILFGAGIVTTAFALMRGRRTSGPIPPSSLQGPILPFSAAAPALVPAGVVGSAAFGLGPLFLFFLKVGSVLFGSGYVLFAFLRADLVDRWHWLTETQLVDAIAAGQLTPGPVFTAATFIGYLLGGFPGALVATVGIFLPAFVFVALSGPLVPRIRASPAAGAFLDGLNVASLALMSVVTLQLARLALVSLPTLLLALVSGVLLIRYRLNSTYLLLAGACLGLLLGPGF